MASAMGVCERATDITSLQRSVKGAATFIITAKGPTPGINSIALAFG